MALSAVENTPRGSEPARGNQARRHEVWPEDDQIDRLVSDLPTREETGSTDHVHQPNLPRVWSAAVVDTDRLRSLVPQPALSPSRVTMHALQEWEGYVLEIGAEVLEARLLDVTAGALHETEEATIPLEEISLHDRERMEVGSIFRWVIGYERSTGGMQKRVSQIVFRDLPVVTDSDVSEGREWARKVMSKFLP